MKKWIFSYGSEARGLEPENTERPAVGSVRWLALSFIKSAMAWFGQVV